MATFNNIESYRKSIATRMKNLSKQANNAVARTSIFLMGRLKKTAPVKSGQLVKSVKRRKIKNGYSVLAGYSNEGFPVGRWVNQEFSVTPKNPRGRATRMLKTPVGQAVFYSKNAPFNATAKEYPWFDKNVKAAQNKFRSSYKKIRAALRG